MTDDQLRDLSQIVEKHERSVRWCLRIETTLLCGMVAILGVCAFAILRRDSGVFGRAVNLASFAFQSECLKRVWGHRRTSRQMLRQIAAWRERVELERMSRL